MAKLRLNLETLNARALPSATFVNGVLTVDGTEGNDVVVVRQMGDQIRVQGQQIEFNGELVKSISASGVSRIDVNALGGNDRINLASVRVASSVDAGNGNDFIVGGQCDDSISGGSGNDRMGGGRGDDSINGDVGDDRINGNSGNDDVFGGVGDDSLAGGADDDLVRGEDGDDRINGNSGNDDCDGGSGRDNCRGGGGHDSVRDDSDGRTEVEGVITAIDLTNSIVSIQTRSGVLVDVTVAASTKIERNDAHVTLAAFQVGDFAEAKFDAAGAAIEIEANTGSDSGSGSGSNGRSRVEGMITAIDLANSKVTIRTWSGQSVVVQVASTTKIERNDAHVTLSAFQVGDRGEARFDASGLTLKLEAEGA